MITDDKKSISKNIIKNQNVVIENRERINVTGVYDVINFDEELVTVDTELGILIIKGTDLKMNRLSLESSELVIEGEINSINYSDKNNLGNTKTSLFNKIFK